MAKRILLVNCYHEKRGEKIRPYVAFIVEAALAAHIDVLVTGMEDEKIARGATVHRHSALIISGSQRMISQGDYHPEFLDFLRSRKIPVLGICYGHQLLARAYGASIEKESSRHAGEETVILRANDPLFAGFPGRFAMSQSHEEVVRFDRTLSKHFELLAVNAGGGVEAIRHKTMPFWGVQFHPERSGENGKMLVANFLKEIS